MKLHNKNQSFRAIISRAFYIHAHLLQRNTIVLKKQKTVVANGNLDLLDKLINNGRILRIQQGEINGLEIGKVVLLFGG